MDDELKKNLRAQNIISWFVCFVLGSAFVGYGFISYCEGTFHIPGARYSGGLGFVVCGGATIYFLASCILFGAAFYSIPLFTVGWIHKALSKTKMAKVIEQVLFHMLLLLGISVGLVGTLIPGNTAC